MDLQSEDGAFGLPALIPRRDIVATVLTLIKGAWKRVCTRPDLNRSSRETQIAGALYLELEREKEIRGLKSPGFVEESPTRTETEMLVGDGRIDLKVIYTFDKDDFLGVEYKRVNASSTRLASEYVKKGMMRFISAKYCPGHDFVNMAGFVMDADSSGAVDSIRTQIETERASLSVHEDWTIEKSYKDIDQIYRTKHLQNNYSTPFTMLHLMLPFEPPK